MKYKLALGLSGLLLGLAAFQGFGLEDASNKQLQIADENVSVEVANTSSERRKGLMYRRSLPENHGMIFIYSNEEPRSFWMKNTYIPLDIIFVDASNTVINIEQADPEPGVSDENLQSYRSERPARYVIELRQGFSEEHGIKPGSKVVFGEELADCCIK